MGRNTADFEGGVNKFYAGATASGRYHAYVEAGPGVKKALCGVKVVSEHDSPQARLDEDEYTPPSQFIECEKCVRAIRKARG